METGVMAAGRSKNRGRSRAIGRLDLTLDLTPSDPQGRLNPR
jgi:hypothetical protein